MAPLNLIGQYILSVRKIALLLDRCTLTGFFILLCCLHFHKGGLLRMAGEVAHVPDQVGHARGTPGEEIRRQFDIVVEDLNLDG